jgi:hypothetical protein
MGLVTVLILHKRECPKHKGRMYHGMQEEVWQGAASSDSFLE